MNIYENVMSKHVDSEVTTSSMAWNEQETESSNSNLSNCEEPSQQFNKEEETSKFSIFAAFYAMCMMMCCYVFYTLTSVFGFFSKNFDKTNKITTYMEPYFSPSYWKGKTHTFEFNFYNYLTQIDKKIITFLSTMGFFKFGKNEDGKQFESSRALLMACLVWADFHHEPGNASVDEFQSELKKNLKEFISPTKGSPFAPISQAFQNKMYTYFPWRVIVVHTTFLKMFFIYWANYKHWSQPMQQFVTEFNNKTTGEKYEDFKKFSSKVFKYWENESYYNTFTTFKYFEMSMDKIGKMNTAVPQATRKEMCEYYQYMWNDMNFNWFGYSDFLNNYTQKILLNEIPPIEPIAHK